MQKQIEQKLDSREVAEMMGISHTNLLQKIDGINEDFRKMNIQFSKYWEENSYQVVGQTRSYRCFLITKRGCEFLAHKTTGTKGNLFTDKYMDRFAEMENYIEKVQAPKLSKELQAIFVLDNRTVEIEKRIDNIENNLPLLGVDCDEVTKTVHGVGVRLLGSKNSNAYKDKSLRRRVYTDIYGELKRQFQVRSYKAIKRCELSKAIDVINNYKLPLALDSEIFQVNNQMSMEVS